MSRTKKMMHKQDLASLEQYEIFWHLLMARCYLLAGVCQLWLLV
jgi:hypothetical protein